MFTMPRMDATVDPQNVMKAFAELLAQNIQHVQKTQTVGAPIGPYLHGPGGLFGVRGLERDLISTMTQITSSLGSMIPASPSNNMDPLFPYITGALRSDQKEKNAVCDNPVDPGNFKTCIQTTVFGRKEFKTRQLEINHVGQRINRGEFMDLSLVNGPLVEQMGGLMSSFYGLRGDQAILGGREMAARFLEVAVAYQRWFCPQVYTGNPSNNSAGGGYKEFPGLDLLISRTKVDALAGTSCPSLYSTIVDFNYKLVSDSTNPDIVRTFQSIFHYLKTKASQQGFDPVEWVIVMRSDLFYELTRYWPCQYNTDACSVGQTLTMDVNYQQTVQLRDAMRVGKYLLIDGIHYPVITDDCIFEDNKASADAIPVNGGFASDIYIVPMTALGGALRTLYFEYFDYSQGTLPAVADLKANTFFWSDGGAFLWGLKAPDNWCVEAISKIEPRLILRTPQLAARLTNVAYVPLIHSDDPLPSGNYHVNGGVVSGYPTKSPYSEWNLGGPGIGA